MGINDYIILLVIAFFCLVLYSVQKDEKRKSNLRKKSLPHPIERRKRERRSKSMHSYLAWVIRSQWSKLTK